MTQREVWLRDRELWKKYLGAKLKHKSFEYAINRNSGQSNWMLYRGIQFKIIYYGTLHCPWWWTHRTGFTDIGGSTPEEAINHALAAIEVMQARIAKSLARRQQTIGS